MQKSTYIIWFVVICCIGTTIAFIIKTGEEEDIGVRYSMVAFQRQWNRYSPAPKANLPSQNESGSFEYGNGVSLRITAHKDRDVVTSARVRYDTRLDKGVGGQDFLLLVQTAINVGTFRWPQERINHVRQFFNFMSPQPRTYRYLHTSFTRMKDPSGMWEFAMNFVPNKPEEDSAAPAPP